MTELVRLVEGIDEARLVEYVTGRRWFGAKSREVAGARVLEATAAREDSPALVLAFVEIRFLPGTHEIYQLPFGLRPNISTGKRPSNSDRSSSTAWAERATLCTHSTTSSACLRMWAKIL